MAKKPDSKKKAERDIPRHIPKGQAQHSSGRGQVAEGGDTERRLWRDARKHFRPER